MGFRANHLVMWGALNGALAVIAGAFGAHGLEASLSPERLSVYQTAATYHMNHALALVLTGMLAAHGPRGRAGPDGEASRAAGPKRMYLWAGGAFLAGILVFSGSLYALAITGIGALGAITPIGGVGFIVGWVLLSAAALSGGRGEPT